MIPGQHRVPREPVWPRGGRQERHKSRGPHGETRAVTPDWKEATELAVSGAQPARMALGGAGRRTGQPLPPAAGTPPALRAVSQIRSQLPCLRI